MKKEKMEEMISEILGAVFGIEEGSVEMEEMKKRTTDGIMSKMKGNGVSGLTAEVVKAKVGELKNAVEESVKKNKTIKTLMDIDEDIEGEISDCKFERIMIKHVEYGRAVRSLSKVQSEVFPEFLECMDVLVNVNGILPELTIKGVSNLFIRADISFKMMEHHFNVDLTSAYRHLNAIQTLMVAHAILLSDKEREESKKKESGK